MSKGMIAFIVVAIIALSSLVIISMKRSAVEARKKSDDIMENFKTVDKDLKKYKDRYDSSTNRLIDSLSLKLKQWKTGS